MENLIIVGAGGCGREVLQWIKDINKVSPRWNIKGFINDFADSLDGIKCDYSILAEIDKYHIEDDDLFICAIGDSAGRRLVETKLKNRGARFATIIHPTAVVADNAEIGEGCILYPFAVISDNTKIGKSCIINMHSNVAHDSEIGEYCTICAHCDVTGRCKVGNDVFMGTGARLVPDISVADDAFICAGSVVMTKVRKGMKVMGNPAKRITF